MCVDASETPFLSLVMLCFYVFNLGFYELS